MAAGRPQSIAESAESLAPTARFERGELSVEQYLEALINDAIRLVESTLPANRVEWMRELLRRQLETDPVVRERVRRVAGRHPKGE